MLATTTIHPGVIRWTSPYRGINHPRVGVKDHSAVGQIRRLVVTPADGLIKLQFTDDGVNLGGALSASRVHADRLGHGPMTFLRAPESSRHTTLSFQ